MMVFTLDTNLQGKTVVVEHNVVKVNGVPGQMVFTCTPKTINGSYDLDERNQPVYLTQDEAEWAIHEQSKGVAV